jgi:hypothetical protein
MKPYKKFSLFILLFFSLSCISNANAQKTVNEKQSEEAVSKDLIDSKNYVFRAKTVHPQSSSIRHLTSE